MKQIQMHLHPEYIALIKDGGKRIELRLYDEKRHLPVELLTGGSMSKEELLEELERFYTPEDQVKYGVLGIRIKKI